VETRISTYNDRHGAIEGELTMPRRKKQITEFIKDFGERLAQLRQAAGYSQRDFAAEVGISQRMVVYYESECERMPIHLLPLFARVLGVSTDQLLGIEKIKSNDRRKDNRLWRRFSQVEKLPPSLRKQIVQILDAFLERERLRQAL